ncbi:Rap1a/Tai family immunity protein [Sandarakinorhabdus rubra]|uniref:Rap1a/Tai family immunity protein n=1 Tax=Sandarakinorhabdus rubra TaxID=2672568 RepID=UPI0013DD2BFE|nr:Rap1a/Tai family immunity protein [Sandarakinorhabdus rubra]
MRLLLPVLLLSAAASAQPADNPVAMATGAHLKAVCSRQDDRASRIICLSWLNGASQGHGWFTPKDAALTPPHCRPGRDYDLAEYRGVILAWLDRHPADLDRPSIEVYSRALAAKWPCRSR